MVNDARVVALIAKVREIANARPDDIYIQPEGSWCCFYSKGLTQDAEGEMTGCGCIIGQALWSLDERLPQDVRMREEDGDSMGIDHLLREMEIFRTSNQAAWLAQVQDNQDAGMTFRACIALADKEIARSATK